MNHCRKTQCYLASILFVLMCTVPRKLFIKRLINFFLYSITHSLGFLENKGKNKHITLFYFVLMISTNSYHKLRTWSTLVHNLTFLEIFYNNYLSAKPFSFPLFF